MNNYYKSHSLNAKTLLLEVQETLLNIGIDEEVNQLRMATRRFDFVEAGRILESIAVQLNIDLEKQPENEREPQNPDC